MVNQIALDFGDIILHMRHIFADAVEYRPRLAMLVGVLTIKSLEEPHRDSAAANNGTSNQHKRLGGSHTSNAFQVRGPTMPSTNRRSAS